MGLSRVELAAVAVILLSRGCVTSATGGRTDWIDSEDPPRAGSGTSTTHIFETPEDSVFATPWFTVSSVVLRVRRMQHPTVIILPEHSAMRTYMVDAPAVVASPSEIPRRAATSSVLASLPTTSRRLRRTPPDTATPISTSDWLSTSLLIGPPRIAMVARVRSKRVWILCRLTDSARICW
jgi:hypothetical protein